MVTQVSHGLDHSHKHFSEETRVRKLLSERVDRNGKATNRKVHTRKAYEE